MHQQNSLSKAISQAGLRRLRSTPTYFFLIWRWGTWVYALIMFLALPAAYKVRPFVVPVVTACLVITFVYTLVVTLYTPIAHILIARPGGQAHANHKRRRRQRSKPQLPGSPEENQVQNPLLDTHNPSWNIAIYCLDVVICGLITYFSAVNQDIPFGDASPFYRYGLSAVLVAGFTYSYTGGLLAALGYSLLAVLGASGFPLGHIGPPGQTQPYAISHLGVDLAGSIIDAPLIALLAAYISGLLNSAVRSKRQVQEHARRESALRGVSEMLVTGTNDQVQLLHKSVKAIRKGGHFDKLVIALVRYDHEQVPQPDFDTYVEADVSAEGRPDVSEELVSLVAKTGRQHAFFATPSTTADGSTYGMAYLYRPFFKEKQLCLVIGAESRRYTPFDQKQEEFLAIVGAQLMVALENIRLTAETAELATLSERGRIAREIHDGIAQLLYMLSLNSETGLALVERTAGKLENGERVLAPISQNMERQVAISKQALWETRHYMFMLRPLISGDTTLTQMLANQLREFEAISGLPARLEVEGDKAPVNGDQQSNRRRVQVGMAIFRITQEALTNAYKHAEASQIEVHLRYQPEYTTVEISDNGRGIAATSELPSEERVYSGRGLYGMRERATELGGSVEIEPKSDGGTRVLARIPI